MIKHSILDALDNVKQTGPGEFMASCPAHHDTKPSLHITEKGDKLLLHCFGNNCSIDEILGGLNLDRSALHIGSSKSDVEIIPRWVRGKKTVAIHEYLEPNGLSVRYYKLRLEGKDFSFGRIVDGKWEAGLGGIGLLPYYINEVLKASLETIIFIVEGEKDADRLRSLNLIAVSGPTGSSGWKKSFGKYFEGKNVVIIPDNDDSGRKYEADVRTSLEGLAASTTTIELDGLSEGEDVSDWLDSGHCVDELLEMLTHLPKETANRSNPLTVLTTGELLRAEFPEPEFVVSGLVPEGLTLLVGKPKVGKSWLCMDLALSVVSGQPALGKLGVEQGHALYLALEDQERRIASRLRSLGADEVVHKDLRFVSEMQIGTDGGVSLLDRYLRQLPETRLVLVDTLAKVRASRGHGGSNQYQIDYQDLEGFQELAAAYPGLAIVIVHHTRKSDSDDPMDLVSGTLGLTGCADTVLVLTRARLGSRAELFVSGRDLCEAKFGVEFRQDKRWHLLDDVSLVNITPERERIMDALRSSEEPMGPKEISIATGLSHDGVRQTLGKMLDAGTISRPAYGRYELPRKGGTSLN